MVLGLVEFILGGMVDVSKILYLLIYSIKLFLHFAFIRHIISDSIFKLLEVSCISIIEVGKDILYFVIYGLCIHIVGGKFVFTLVYGLKEFIFFTSLLIQVLIFLCQKGVYLLQLSVEIGYLGDLVFLLLVLVLDLFIHLMDTTSGYIDAGPFVIQVHFPLENLGIISFYVFLLILYSDFQRANMFLQRSYICL